MTDSTPIVWKPEEMIQVQPDSVVSRTLVNQSAGTITLFAFDTGQGLSEHTAPYAALVHVASGRLLIRISGREFHLKSGEMILMPANEPHALQAEEQVRFLLTMIRA